MKKLSLIALIILAGAGYASAQIATPTTDVLGAHLNYGRGCAACHAPHSGAYGNGNAKSADSTSGNIALWGEDVGSLYGKTMQFGQADHGGVTSSVTVTMPTSMTPTDPTTQGVLLCMSCHDGNYAAGAMMKNQVYETLPATYGSRNAIPTLLGNDGGGTANYLNDHPVGVNAEMTCGGTYDWDCTISATGAVNMTGPASSKFVQNYGFFVRPAVFNSKPVVMCTTCHNQHVMNTVAVTAKNSGQPAGNYATMFFIRAPYNPASGTAASNQTAQFCRQCHGAEANEMNGSTAGTTY